MAEDAKVTIRMGPEELQIMDDFVADNPNLGSRSNFIRAAIRAYVSGDAPETNIGQEEGGIFVRFSEVQLNALSMIKAEGMCFDEEEFIRTCVLNEIVTEEVRNKTMTNAFSTAQLTSKMK
ncbi:MAG TPA: ribbon-helix-helix domain-containing protein [Candidatus Methanomethylophilaceae archaeon]|nr:ribbon-helix-helix domain-containing protein [Candidatus Methanomethylophilaceae archaeon]